MIHLSPTDRGLKGYPKRPKPADRPTLSVVIPMRDEGQNIEPLFMRLWAVLTTINLDAEIICIDDGSVDDTLDRLKALRQCDPRLRIVSFSRNFGKEVALTAGLRYARGDAVVLMDGDLQHPPESIELFVEYWRQGYQMVYGSRRCRQKVSRWRQLMARLFYKAFAVVAQTRLPPGACDFRLIDRRAVDALNSLTERTRFSNGLFSWIGFKQIAVPFDVEKRKNGQSGWTVFGLCRLSLDAITSFSMMPLRIWSYAGAFFAMLAVSSGIYMLVAETIFGASLPATPYVIAAVSFFAGIQLLSLGVIGEYVGRVFTEVKQRPLFLVAEEVGFADAVDGGELAPVEEPPVSLMTRHGSHRLASNAESVGSQRSAGQHL